VRTNLGKEIQHRTLSGVPELKGIGGKAVKLHNDRKRDDDGPAEVFNEQRDR